MVPCIRKWYLETKIWMLGVFITTWVLLLLGPLSVQSLEVLIHVGILIHALHAYLYYYSICVGVCYIS